MLREQIESASPDLLKAMVKPFADALMSAEADAMCGARYGERSPKRVNSRNGHRARDVNGKRILISCRQLKMDHLPVHDSSVLAAGTRPRSRFLSR